jgi:predicted HTH transcriptional regulator
LLVDQLPEGQRLEYKAALLLDSRKQKAEAAKDISGMANAQGGWIIFGIAEGDGEEPLPSQATPLPATGLQTRLENILDTSLEPIPDYQAATISIEEGVVIVVRVSKGTQPVMVQGYGLDHCVLFDETGNWRD